MDITFTINDRDFKIVQFFTKDALTIYRESIDRINHSYRDQFLQYAIQESITKEEVIPAGKDAILDKKLLEIEQKP